ncbi:hypothetical protein BJX61DRAFT_514235 [Aspergillus egyptiacus]|nr:hypothetical protein BJX61DRAFT_514235 [Aspergillus egyptiacus]
MSFVLAQREGWDAANGDDGKSLEPVVLGPFANLRDGVCAKTSSGGGGEAQADFFMWEHFTTKPFFQANAGSSGTGKEEVPLKKIGEIFTPWPSWMIVASNTVFPDPANDERLSRLFEVLDEGIGAFRRDTERVVSLLGSGELGCHYGEEDAREWLKDVRFAEGTRGVDGEVIGGVVDVLKVAGVIDEGVERGDAVQRVVGVKRG